MANEGKDSTPGTHIAVHHGERDGRQPEEVGVIEQLKIAAADGLQGRGLLEGKKGRLNPLPKAAMRGGWGSCPPPHESHIIFPAVPIRQPDLPVGAPTTRLG